MVVRRLQAAPDGAEPRSPEFDFRFLTGAAPAESLTDDEYKAAVQKGVLTVEVLLQDAQKYDSRLWTADRCFSESSSLPEEDSHPDGSDLSETSSGSKLRRRIDDLLRENADARGFWEESFGKAFMKVATYAQNRVLAWWLTKSRNAASPAMTATKMLGGDFSPAVLTLYMQNLGSNQAQQPQGIKDSLYYRFYVAPSQLPWTPVFKATHLIYRHQFNEWSRRLQIERPLREVPRSSQHNEWAKKQAPTFDWRQAFQPAMAE
jgi:hypothetical protein